ncbi:MAG: hypothetical protein K6E78_06990 [Treponema sp.]|nr:hypothetical protein [Treponema sp.]
MHRKFFFVFILFCLSYSLVAEELSSAIRIAVPEKYKNYSAEKVHNEHLIKSALELPLLKHNYSFSMENTTLFSYLDGTFVSFSELKRLTGQFPDSKKYYNASNVWAGCAVFTVAVCLGSFIAGITTTEETLELPCEAVCWGTMPLSFLFALIRMETKTYAVDLYNFHLIESTGL